LLNFDPHRPYQFLDDERGSTSDKYNWYAENKRVIRYQGLGGEMMGSKTESHPVVGIRP